MISWGSDVGWFASSAKCFIFKALVFILLSWLYNTRLEPIVNRELSVFLARNSSHITTQYSSCACYCCCWGDLFKKVCRFKFNSHEICRDCSSVKSVSTTESDFWYDISISRWRLWRHCSQETAATWWVNVKRLASASSWSVVHSYLLNEMDWSQNRKYCDHVM